MAVPNNRRRRAAIKIICDFNIKDRATPCYLSAEEVLDPDNYVMHVLPLWFAMLLRFLAQAGLLDEVFYDQAPKRGHHYFKLLFLPLIPDEAGQAGHARMETLTRAMQVCLGTQIAPWMPNATFHKKQITTWLLALQHTQLRADREAAQQVLEQARQVITEVKTQSEQLPTGS